MIHKTVPTILLRFLTTVVIMITYPAYGHAVGAVNSGMVHDALARLDNELRNRESYIQLRNNQIDSTQKLLADPNLTVIKRLDIIDSLTILYNGFLTDSVLKYCDEGIKLAHEAGLHDRELNFRLRNAYTLPLVGIFSDAENMFEQIELDSLSTEELKNALAAGRQMYSYLASFYSSFPERYNHYNQHAIELQARIISLFPADSPDYLLNQGEYLFMTGNYIQAKTLLQELISQIDPGSNMAARANHMISQIASREGHDDEHIYYLTLSAIADVRSATREVVSLQDLGMELYKHDDLDRAYDYLSVALESAVKCNASMRMLQTSGSLPVINAAHMASIQSRTTKMLMAGAFCLFLFIVLVTVLWVLRREMERMKKLQQHLAGTNKIKEMYMSQFVNLCTIYMNKLHQFCKIATRKISTGHTDELYRLTKSGRFVEQHAQEFYDTFDRAFLHIYPNFPSEVNALLLADQQIELREGELLNTDLRILAFMRLGVNESPRIAQALNYSIHTIYAYRNRLKNRAINRDTFENDIMKID